MRGGRLGKQPPCYGPTDPVNRAQAISFVTRAMVAKGYWQQQPDNPALYPDVSDPTHRADLATYTYYAGAVPGTASTTSNWPQWNQPSTRGWFAQALWQALNAYAGVAVP